VTLSETGSQRWTPQNLLPGVGELSDAAFRAIVDMAAHPYLIVDDDGTIVYAGGSLARVVGWEPAQVVGRSVADFLPDDQLMVAMQAIDEVRERNPGLVGAPMIMAIRRPDDALVWIEIGGLALTDDADQRRIVLRLRSWEGERHLESALHRLLAGQLVDEVQLDLCRSIASWLEAGAAGIHRGFDGSGFERTIGWGLPAPWDESVTGPWTECAKLGVPVQRSIDELPASVAGPARRAGLTQVWCVPVPRFDEQNPAVISLWPVEEGGPFLGHRLVLDRMARYVQLSLVRSAEHERLLYLAGHDSLTGVANRASFRAMLADALAARETNLAVAFCDLDDFKPINDRFGHEAGDGVLIEAAARLRAALRGGDEIARMGGDEFTVLLHNVPHPAAASLLAERLLDAMRRPFLVGEEEVSLGLSIGIVRLDDVDGTTPDDVLARADAALYDVKRSGGGRAVVR